MSDEYDDLLSSLSSGASDPNRLALNNPQVKDFLNRIGQSEGADYHTLVGGTKINDLSRHPNKVGLVTDAGPSTAFGKYQITGTTNRTKLAKYANLDYSPENQDVRAVELLRQTGALDDLYNNDFQSAVKKAGKEWASLPGSTLPGQKNHAAFQQKPTADEYDTLLDSLTQGQSKPTAAAPVPPSPTTPIVGTGRGAGMARAQTTTYPSRQTRAQVRKAAQPLAGLTGAIDAPDTAPLATNAERETGLRPLPGLAAEQAKTTHEGLQALADMSGLPTRILPESAANWINEAVGEGAAGLTRLAGNVARIPSQGGGMGPLAIGGKIIADSLEPGANEISRDIQQASEEANRNWVSRTAQGVVSGGITSAPAMILTSLGVPAPVAFGLLSAAEANGKDAHLMDVLTEATKGAAVGSLFDLPIPIKTGILQRIGKGLAVGGGTYGIDKLTGAKDPATNALVMGLFGAMGGKGEGEAPEERPTTQTVSDEVQGKLRGGEINQTLAAREATVKPPMTPEEGTATVVRGTLRDRPTAGQIDLPTGERPPTPQIPESLGVVGPTKPIGRAPQEGAKLNRWQHRDFGLVTESADQSGIRKAQVRVMDQDGNEHVIQRPKGTGAGNQIAVPVREKPTDARLADAQAQAEENPPFKVIDRRRDVTPPPSASEPSTVTPTTPAPSSSEGKAETPQPEIQGYDSEIRQQAVDGQMEHRRLGTSPDTGYILKENNFPLDTENVTVYRVAPGSIRVGDYVSLNREYAEQYVGDREGTVQSQTVPVSDLIQGADAHEVIYAPRSKVQSTPQAATETRSLGSNIPEQTLGSQPAESVPRLTKAQQRKATEIQPPETTGIAQRVEQMRRESLNRIEARRGEGVSAADSVQRGRQLLSDGRDPQDAVDSFQKTGAISADAMALVRAKHEELARAANKAYDEHGIDSPEFKTAEKARQDWWEKSVKPMQTEWSNTGRAQQGETAIDTGTFYGLYRAFKQETGREMTVPEQAKAQRIVDRVAAADRGVQETQKALIDQINRATGIADLPPEIQQPLKRLIDQAQREVRTQRRAQTRKTLDDEAATIKTSLAAAFQKIKSQTGVQASGLARLDPEGEITKLAVQYAKNRVKAGVTDVAQLVDEVHAAIRDFADVTRREVAEAISGIGVSREKREPTDWMKTKAELRKGLKVEDQAQKLSDLRDRLSKGGKITPDDAKTIWQHARENYVDKGAEVGDAIQSTANDLGTTPQQIRRAIANQPKAKRLTNEMYQQMSARRQARSAAEQWVKNTDRSPGLRALQGSADLFFNLKTFGHGTVGPVTHAGENIFHPTRWVNYIKNVGRTWKSAYSSAAHERYMQDLVNDPNYVTARRAGLANEPGKFYDEYQNTQMQKLFGAVGKIGNRGFDVLKTMRQDFFNARWNKLDESQQTPETAKVIADLVNHSTGAIGTRLPYPNLTRGVMFAAPLEASRWARILGDPIKATDTFINWKSAKPEDKYFAKAVVKNHAGFLATYLSALAANQAILIATGSNDRVNFTDPSKGDWLRMKILGRAIEPTGGLISTIDFLGKLGQAAVGAPNPKEGRFERMGKAAAQYGRGKLSPIASTATDFISQSDFRNRPMPFSVDKEREGRPRYSWAEYLLSQQSPIPLAEGVHDWFDEMRKQDVPVSTTKQIFNAVMSHPAALGKGAAIGTLSGSTGVRIGAEYGLTKAQQRKLANQQPTAGQGLQLPPPQRLSP